MNEEEKRGDEWAVGADELRNWLAGHGFSFDAREDPDHENECNWTAWRRSRRSTWWCSDEVDVYLQVDPRLVIASNGTFLDVAIWISGCVSGARWEMRAWLLEPGKLPEMLDDVEQKLIDAWGSVVS